MASQQQMRKDNKQTRDQISQGDQVPQVAHFESLTVMDSGNQPPAVVHRVVETVHADQSKTQKHETQGTQFYSAQSQKQKNNYGGNQKGSQQQQQNLGVTDTMMNAGKKGASYASETATAAKDIAAKTGKTSAEYAGKAAGVAKDAALVAGMGAAEVASKTTTGAEESMESLNAGVGRVVEDTATVAEKATGKALGVAGTVVDVGRKGAGYVGETMVRGKDVAFQTGKTTAGYVGKAADVAEGGVRESMEGLNAGVGGVIEETAAVTEKVGGKVVGAVVGAPGTAAGIGKKGVVVGKDVAVKTGKAAVGYVGKAADVATGIASDTASGVTASMESLNAGVGGLVEGTALAAEKVAQKTFDTVVDVGSTVVDVGKKGASYLGGKAVAGKDVSLEAGKATGEYAGKAVGVAKDAALVGGWTAAELASDTGEGVTESMECVNRGVAGLVEGTAKATEDVAQKTFNTVVDVSKKGASYMGEKAVAGKDVTLETGKTAAGYVGKAADVTGKTAAGFVGKAADVVKDATLVAGWGAAELASGTAAGVTESMESLNAGVGGLVEGTASVTENVAKNTFDTMADAGKKGVVAGKNIAMETGKTTAGYVGKAVDVAKGAALAAGRGATEFGSDTSVDSKGSLSAGNVGAGTKPKNVVVEREEVTINYGQGRNAEMGNRKEQRGYQQ